jgi:gallate decarboxylase subunit D
LEIRIKTGDDVYSLEAFVKNIGNDLLVSIFGGQRPHIGAVAVALPRPSLKDPKVRSATASVFCYPGHKEDVIAKEAAERLSAALDTNVTVTAGAHWDNIDRSGIRAVLKSNRQLIEMIIKRISDSFPESSL